MHVPCCERSALLARLMAALCFCLPLTAAAELVISDAWVRAVPPVASDTAGYCVIRNSGDAERRITAVRSDAARHVMMHRMVRNDQGLRQMHHVDALVLAPGETVTLAPGGMHLMIMGLDGAPAPGEALEICLETDHGAPLCEQFEVRRQHP